MFQNGLEDLIIGCHMNKITLAPGIVVYKNVDLDINDFIMNLTDEEWNNEAVMFSGGVVAIDDDVRKTLSFEVPAIPFKAQTERIKEISGLIGTAIKDAEQDYFLEHFIEPKSHQPFKIFKYIKGGHFSSHSDDGGGTFRRVSTVYYVNDDYEGGEIEFTRFGIIYKPEAKDFVVFPSAYVYTHRVLPVTKGVRYSIGSWVR